MNENKSRFTGELKMIVDSFDAETDKIIKIMNDETKSILLMLEKIGEGMAEMLLSQERILADKKDRETDTW